MKKLIKLVLAGILSISTLNAKSCTDEQIANMIKQNISESTINIVCNSQNSLNLDADYSNNMAQKVENDYREHFFWRIGIGNMSISESDFSASSINLGLQYFMNGLKENGFGIGISTSHASMDFENNEYYYSQEYSLEETTSEIEFMYNFNIGNGYNITPAYITGSITERYLSEYSSTVYLDEKAGLNGIGIYFNFSSIVESGQGLSVFLKKLNIYKYDQDITLTGLQFVW